MAVKEKGHGSPAEAALSISEDCTLRDIFSEPLLNLYEHVVGHTEKNPARQCEHPCMCSPLGLCTLLPAHTQPAPIH